jgi:hypothetical protein
VQTLLGLLEMAAASAIAASTGRAKSWKRIVCVCVVKSVDCVVVVGRECSSGLI